MAAFSIGPTAELLSGARLLWQLPRFLRQRVRLDQARETVRVRLMRRGPDFLAHLRHFVFGQPSSPYRRLLGLAGCEYGDLERLVAQEGLEGALAELAHRGVYLTVDEFKGRRVVRRGSTTFVVEHGPAPQPRTGWAPDRPVRRQPGQRNARAVRSLVCP